MWIPIKDILPSTVNKLRIKNGIDRIKICKLAEEKMKEIYSKNIKVLNFKNGDLIIQCGSHSLANEIHLNQRHIIESINSCLGKDKIKKIKFVVKDTK
ncbi:DUF721 domain-containing protein [bacterium]|nr:DUF721 domain-containing protein [bacterium]